MSPSTAATWRGVIIAPGPTFTTLARDETAGRVGLLAVIVTGIAWAMLLAWLGASGHAPSGRALLPIPMETYYLWQAGFVVPVHLAMFATLAGVAHALARRAGGQATRRATANVAGLAMAVPSFLAWLIPDAVVVASAGFDALAPAMRVYVPVSMVWTVALLGVGLRAAHGISTGRAVAIAIVGLLAHALVGAPFLR